jgi:IclR family pca regulon transcriptional regulator
MSIAPPRTGVKSAARVLDVLEILAVAPAALGVSEIARRLAIPKSSASMLLLTLEGRGYVLDEGDRRFALHPSVRGGASAWVGGPRARLIRHAQAPLARLSRASGETSFLAVASDSRNIEYVAKSVSAKDLRVDVDLRVPRAIHVTSAGLAMLAHQPREMFDRYVTEGPLARMTRYTITDPDKLRRELAVIRTRGYALQHQAFALHDSGLAAAILGAEGEVLGALNVSAPTKRFAPIVHVVAAKVMREARRLAAELESP